MQELTVPVDPQAQLQPGQRVRWRFCLGPEMPTGPPGVHSTGIRRAWSWDP